ncbi:hypothetical protein HQ545_04345 [Candidatus Woesearchaeota archaeon]|nr:hypothetical protein [Candidatus Woesearchaeota archaeon]
MSSDYAGCGSGCGGGCGVSQSYASADGPGASGYIGNSVQQSFADSPSYGVLRSACVEYKGT